jgi:hypothetical protein
MYLVSPGNVNLARPAISLWWTVTNSSSHIAVSTAICEAISVLDATIIRARGVLALEDACLLRASISLG